MLYYREPVYQGITEERKPEDYNAKNPVQRRSPLSKNLKERLTNIVSLYVPNNQPYTLPSQNQDIKAKLIDHGSTDGIQDHFGLLTLNDINGANTEDQELCKINLLIEKSTLFTAISESLQGSEYVIDNLNQIFSFMNSDGTFIYLGLENIPYIFKVNTLSLYGSRNKEGSILITKLHLKLNESCELFPNCIALNQTNPQTDEIYVIGQTGAVYPNVSLNVLACFSFDGQLLAQTRKYSYRRYLAIDLDIDGNVLLACATGQLNSSNGTHSAQICKLTPHFERRIFSITMKKCETFYLPEWITKTSAGGRCWASVSRDEPILDTNCKERNVTRRIFAFPGIQPSECKNGLQSPKKWLQIISWNFDAFSSGSVMALDSNRLLALDTEKRSLAVITWPADKPSAIIQRITKPGERTIDHFCSKNIKSSNNTASAVAYLLSNGDIFQLSLSTGFIEEIV